MKKLVSIVSVALLFFSCQNQAQTSKVNSTVMTTNLAKETIYQFKVTDSNYSMF